MSFETLLATLISFLCVFCYHLGLTDGRGEKHRKPPVSVDTETAEDKKFNQLMENINSYNGSEYGQKEVK